MRVTAPHTGAGSPRLPKRREKPNKRGVGLITAPPPRPDSSSLPVLAVSNVAGGGRWAVYSQLSSGVLMGS